MAMAMWHIPDRQNLRTAFGGALKEGEALSRYTSSRIGGPAEFLAVAENADQLAEMVRTAWRFGLKTFVIGSGSNILVSDTGIRGLVIVNRAQGIEFREAGEHLTVRAESGVFFGALAHQCVQRGWAGLEWAVPIPGTLGGAVYGNAGAHGGETARQFRMAEILQPDGLVRTWTREEMAFSYRSSALKRHGVDQTNGRVPSSIILAAEFELVPGDAQALQAKVDEFVARRKRTQPPGANMGSVFKNPPGDHAARLIEAAGLKGKRIGQVEISTCHANFFINLGGARAADVFALIHLAHEVVKAKFEVDLELEVELVGEWGGQC
jgi:UDP-N-acetylmuramate dehydrogenase